jgi:hypothetical protein
MSHSRERRKTPPAKAPPIKPTRKIKEASRIMLAVAAGGRCEFPGCNKFLFEHPLTLRSGNFSENAHIVAFSPDGPRGRARSRPNDVNDPSNLMLLCQTDHKHIDDHPEAYSKETLRAYKVEHERRIRLQTDAGPDLRTTVVQLKARIGTQQVDIPIHHVSEAVAPRYPSDTRGFVIDLTHLAVDDDAFVAAAEKTIASRVRHLYEDGMDLAKTQHISLFALAPIYVLVYLGTRLSNKITVDFYQRHRDGPPWIWKKEEGPPVAYASRKTQTGTDPGSVALVLSLSGTVHHSLLPPNVGPGHTIYEVTLEGRVPSTDFLRRREDLEAFRRCYRSTLETIRRDHPNARAIDLFPAVPAPVAVACGYDLLPKVDPLLRVFDNDRSRGGFTLRTTIKPNDEQ